MSALGLRDLVRSAPLLFALAACGGAPAPLDAQARAFVQSAQAGLARGQRPDALAVQRLKALALEHPSDPALEQLLLQLLPALRDWDGLARWLEAKGELDDDERIALAKVYVNLADHDGAWRTIEPVAERAPAALEANALAGRAAFLRGDAAAAAKHFDRVWDAMRDAARTEEMSYRAMLHLDAGAIEQARTILEQALAADPDSLHVHNALARVLSAAGELQAAQSHERRATELQAALSAAEQRAMRAAAQNSLLNETWARGDLEGTERHVLRFLAEADAARADELLAFLEALYRAADREAEAPAALDAARRLVQPSAER